MKKMKNLQNLTLSEIKFINGGEAEGNPMKKFGLYYLLYEAATSWSVIKQAASDAWNGEYNPTK